MAQGTAGAQRQQHHIVLQESLERLEYHIDQLSKLRHDLELAPHDNPPTPDPGGKIEVVNKEQKTFWSLAQTLELAPNTINEFSERIEGLTRQIRTIVF